MVSFDAQCKAQQIIINKLNLLYILFVEKFTEKRCENPNVPILNKKNKTKTRAEFQSETSL